MDEKAETQSSAEENVLTESEIAQLNIKITKSHRTDKDWDFIKMLLQDKRLYTLQPSDQEYMQQYCLEGVLKDNGALAVFTNLKDCAQYAQSHEIARTQSQAAVVTIPFQHIIEIANDYEMGVYIDRKPESHQRFLYYDGKAHSIHVMQR